MSVDCAHLGRTFRLFSRLFWLHHVSDPYNLLGYSVISFNPPYWSKLTEAERYRLMWEVVFVELMETVGARYAEANIFPPTEGRDTYELTYALPASEHERFENQQSRHKVVWGNAARLVLNLFKRHEARLTERFGRDGFERMIFNLTSVIAANS